MEFDNMKPSHAEMEVLLRILEQQAVVKGFGT